MAKINGLDKMSFAELTALRDRVDEAMVAAKAAEKQSLREAMEALAAEAGFSVSEVIGNVKAGRKSPLKGTKIAAKYQNPKDSSQTWTGRGRKPNWLVEATSKGQKLESFLV